MIPLLISCGKWMIISFNLPFTGKKDCVIKQSVANKTDTHLSMFILGQFYSKMWSGAPNYLYNFAGKCFCDTSQKCGCRLKKHDFSIE